MARPSELITVHCRAMTPQNVVSDPASDAASCAMLIPTKPPGSSYAAATPEKNTDGMSPKVAKKSEKSCASASRRPVTKARVDTGRAPRIRASRRSGSAFSQITIATSPAAIIASVSSTRRSVAMAGPSVPGSYQRRVYFWMKKPGSVRAGVATRTTLQITSCTCGRPGGIRSLSNSLTKNVRASSLTCLMVLCRDQGSGIRDPGCRRSVLGARGNCRNL